ncbi:MAG TPA: hypothetical protein VHL80_09115 [Polyangia bacterium]|nr:hypothetical protein [Polyangia bacterium]
MTVDEIHDQVVALEGEIAALEPGAPELAAVVARIRELEGDLERARGALGPLIPDASSPKSPAETSADDLAGALANLKRAAEAKRETASP